MKCQPKPEIAIIYTNSVLKTIYCFLASFLSKTHDFMILFNAFLLFENYKIFLAFLYSVIRLYSSLRLDSKN